MPAPIDFFGNVLVPGLASAPPTVSTKIAAETTPSIPSQLESLKERSGGSSAPHMPASTTFPVVPVRPLGAEPFPSPPAPGLPETPFVQVVELVDGADWNL
jgi:hypothetical protein